MACHRASIGRQCGILRDNLSIPLPQSRLFPSRGVARPTLTLRYIHYSFAQCLPCVVQVENMRRFADGIDMRADLGVCLSRQALGVRQTSRGHKAPRSSAFVVCGVVLLLPGLACGPARGFRQTHFAPLPRVDVFGRSPWCYRRARATALQGGSNYPGLLASASRALISDKARLARAVTSGFDT